MANKTIPDLDAAGALAAADLFEISQSAASRKATSEQVRVFLSALPINVETSSYTLVLADAGKTVEMNAGSANNLTVPANSSVAFPVGTVVEVCQVGAGTTTIVEDGGVTVQIPSGLTLVLRGQWSTVSLRKRATDEWVIAGDLAETA